MGTARTGVVLALLLGAPAAAQSPGYQAWQDRESEQFQQFQQREDAGFSSYLKQQWQEFQLSQQPGPYQKPKPTQAPVRPGQPAPPRPEPPRPEPVRPPVPPLPAPVAPAGTVPLTFAYYGTPVTVHVPPSLRVVPQGALESRSVAAYWEAADKTPYASVVQQLQDVARHLLLNDWGVVQLAWKTAVAVHPAAREAAYLLTWFLLTKSGYQAKVGYLGNQVGLLLPSASTWYNARFFTFPGSPTRFYLVQPDEQRVPALASIHTYEKDAPGARKTLDLHLATPPVLRQDTGTRELRFRHGDRDYSVTARHDRALVEFLKDYPTVDFPVYFTARPSSPAVESLVQALQPLVKGRAPLDAVNLLLHFVQSAFPYRADEEQFGREKWLFPDETLAYPASDCEDRAILFAFLVHRLLGLDAVALEYPNHLATAVALPAPGDGITHAGKRYAVADPTYIGADVGMTMPVYASVAPKVIAFP